MFWKKFYDLCVQNNTKPIPVVKTLGIATGAVTKWKNGSIPNGDTLLKIAEYFNVSVDYLLGRTDFSDEENRTICSNIVPLIKRSDSKLTKNNGVYTYIPPSVINEIKDGTYKFTNEILLQISEFYDKQKEYFLIPSHSNYRKNVNISLYNEMQDLTEDEEQVLLNFIKSIKSKRKESAPEEEYNLVAWGAKETTSSEASDSQENIL